MQRLVGESVRILAAQGPDCFLAVPKNRALVYTKQSRYNFVKERVKILLYNLEREDMDTLVQKKTEIHWLGNINTLT